MVAGGSPEWLPAGFTVKFKYKKGRKIKYYFNVATGKEYHSKKEVIHCATEDNSLLVTPKSKNGDGNGPTSINTVDVIPEKTNDSAAWLPDGWKVEERRQKNRNTTYKIYTDLASGSIYYSKAAVIRYLNSMDHSDTPTKKNKSDNVDDPLSDMSQQVLPMTNTRSTRAKTRTDNSLVTSDNVIDPLPDMSQQVLSMTNTRSTRAKTRTDNSLVTSDIVVDPLPDMSQQVLSMTNTRSTRAKTRTDNSLVTIVNVDEMVPKKSPQAKSMTSTRADRGQIRNGNSPVKIDTVTETFPDMSPQAISSTNNDGICENKRKSNTFVMVSIERTTANDLPTGWIQEIRTSQSGVKIRKDPFYIDPASGYVFRSKPDALRYLKTNDIRSCLSRPLKRGLDEIKLIDNNIHSSNPANEKISMNKRQRFDDEESNAGGENSGTKSPSQPKTKILKQNKINHNSIKATAVGAVSLDDKASCENSNENAELAKNPESENYVSKMDPKVMAVDVTISSPITDPSIKQQVPESGGTNKTGSRKSKKRKDPSLPLQALRASKRLAGSEPEIQSTLNLSERTLRAAVRVITSSEVDASPSFPHEASKGIPQSSIPEPVKETADQTVVDDEAPQDVNQLKEVEKPPTESSAIPENPSGEKASEKTLDDGQRSQESQLCYDFGESWSDPLEFALKTLRGELPIEDTLTFSRCFEEKVDTTFNQQPQFAAPINFQSGLTSHSEPLKKQNAADPLPVSSPLFSTLQNAVNPLPASPPLFSTLQNAVNPLPASPPLFSAIGNIGFSPHGGFNYQPSTEVGKKDSKTKFNP